jgi:hypothetical protein
LFGGDDRYRLKGGGIGNYKDACEECLAYWEKQKERAETKIIYFKREIVHASTPRAFMKDDIRKV